MNYNTEKKNLTSHISLYTGSHMAHLPSYNVHVTTPT